MTSAAASLLALSDRNRLTVVRLLLEGPRSVGELVALTGLGQSLVSHHLAVLLRAGWVTARVRGRRRVYAVEVGGTALAPLAAWIRREVALPMKAPGAAAPSTIREAAAPLEDWLL